MAFLLKSTKTGYFYSSYNGHRPMSTQKHRAARMPREECERVKRQLAALGFPDFVMVEEYDTNKVVPVTT